MSELPANIAEAIDALEVAAEQFGSQTWIAAGDGDAVTQARSDLEAAIQKHLEAAPGMLAALRASQAALAMMTAPDAIKSTSVQYAWAQAVEAECKARAAIECAERIR